MQRLTFLTLFFLSLLLFGCGGRTERMRTLLLRQDSLNRAYVTFTTDSTVRLLADYFDHHGTNLDRVLAHYLLGSALRDIREAPAALDEFQKAAELADTTQGGDSIFALLAKVHGQMGILLAKQYLPHLAIEEFGAASHYAMLRGDTADAMTRRLGILQCLNMLNLDDSVLSMTSYLMQDLTASGHEFQALHILSPAIRILLRQGNLTQAKKYLDLYLSKPDTSAVGKRQRVAYHYLFAEYYLGINRLDSAEHFFRLELAEGKDIGNQVRALRGLYHLYSKHVVVDSLIKYTAAYNNLNDSSNIMREAEAILNMKSLYDYSRHERRAAEKTAEAQRLRNIILVSLFIASIAMAGLYSFIRRRKRNAQTEMALLQERHLRNVHQADILRNELETIKGSFGHYRAEKEGELAQLNLILAEQERKIKVMFEQPVNETDIYRHLKGLAAKGQEADMADLAKYKETVQRHLPYFFKKMHSFEYRMTLTEEMVCILVKTGFHPSEIANLLDHTLPGVANIKSRLLRKLYGEEGKTFNFDKLLIFEW